MLSQLTAEGINHILCDSTEDDTWKLLPDFFWTLPHVPFPFADFPLYMFTVRTHSHE